MNILYPGKKIIYDLIFISNRRIEYVTFQKQDLIVLLNPEI